MTFSGEIINVLDYLCGKFGIAIDWTSDNVMPYLEDLCGRYINYEVYTSIAWCTLFGVIVFVTGMVWLIGSIVDKRGGRVCLSDTTEVSCVLFFVFLVMGMLVWTSQAFDIIECYTIPEKTILEYLSQLMKMASH
jgi:hypothetical protein